MSTTRKHHLSPYDFAVPWRLVAFRMGMALALVTLGFSLSASPAYAKILPVASIDVVTPKPAAGSATEILVRFGENVDLPDAAWENFEVSVIPADRASASGWPLDRNYRGTLVPLRRTGKGVYRGSVVLNRAGEYVVFSWSSVFARDDLVQGVVTKFRYASPLRFVVQSVTPAEHAVVHTAALRRLPSRLVAVALSASLLTGLALSIVRARLRTRRFRGPASRP